MLANLNDLDVRHRQVLYQDPSAGSGLEQKPWDGVPKGWREALAAFVDNDDDYLNIWLVCEVGTLNMQTLAANETSLVVVPRAAARVEKGEGRRFWTSDIHDLDRPLVHLRHDRLTFTYQDSRIELKHGAVAWQSLVHHFPHLAPKHIVQDDELAAAIQAGSVATVKIGCLVSAQAEKSTGFYAGAAGSARYAPAKYPVVIREEGSATYQQPLTCALCGRGLWLGIRNGRPVKDTPLKAFMGDQFFLDIASPVSQLGTAQVSFPFHMVESFSSPR